MPRTNCPCSKLITLIILSESSFKKGLISRTTFFMSAAIWISASLLLYGESTSCSEGYAGGVNGTTNATMGNKVSRFACLNMMAEKPEHRADVVLDYIFVAACTIFGFFYTNIILVIFDTVVQDSSRRYRALRRFDSLFAGRVEDNRRPFLLASRRSMEPIIVLDTAEKIAAFETTGPC